MNSLVATPGVKRYSRPRSPAGGRGFGSVSSGTPNSLNAFTAMVVNSGRDGPPAYHCCAVYMLDQRIGQLFLDRFDRLLGPLARGDEMRLRVDGIQLIVVVVADEILDGVVGKKRRNSW